MGNEKQETIKLPANTVQLLREIKKVTGVPISTFANGAIIYNALDLSQETKDKVKDFLKLVRND